MFLDPEGEVATAVEATIRDAAEVAHAGQSEVHELVQEVPHAFLAERHAATDGHAFTQLERGDGLLGAGHHGLLSGNDGQFVHGLFHRVSFSDQDACATVSRMHAGTGYNQVADSAQSKERLTASAHRSAQACNFRDTSRNQCSLGVIAVS